VVSVAAHALLLVAAVVAARRQPPVMPPVYRVELVGAPRRPTPVAPTEAPAPTPPTPAPAATAPAPKTASRQPAVPLSKPARPKPPAPSSAAPAKPNAPSPTAAAPAGTGGVGAEVVSVKTDGIAFPFPGYLQNIVRQIAVRFKPRNPNAPLRADVAFLIHRDGSITNVRFVTRSGSYAFDLEAQGAVEAAGSARAFGPLPSGFADDVLPVTFAFDPRVVR
jgi:protein TonB